MVLPSATTAVSNFGGLPVPLIAAPQEGMTMLQPQCTCGGSNGAGAGGNCLCGSGTGRGS